MQLEKAYIYHIYNQGNNRRQIFFSRENYLFFLKKIKIYITPYTTILSWCLMPNHFHLMVLVNEVELPIDAEDLASSEAFGLQPIKKRILNENESDTVTQSQGVTKTRTLNESIVSCYVPIQEQLTNKEVLAVNCLERKPKQSA